jgi:ribonuclease Y
MPDTDASLGKKGLHMNPAVTGAVIAIAALLAAIGILQFLKAKSLLRDAENTLLHEKEKLEKENDSRRKELLFEAKEEAQRLRETVERENREQKAELAQVERRIQKREVSLERRLENLEKKEREADSREEEADASRRKAEELERAQRSELERIANLTADEGRAQLLSQLDAELEREYARRIKQMEEDINLESERRARKIVALSIQRCAVDQTIESTVSSVSLPSDDMKGRIIGREGRNIRAFETLTGVDLIIDDTPECVVLSAFDPVRREVARLALTNLISDGRIHPGRIEESITRAQEEIEVMIAEGGERAVFETGVTGLHAELVRVLGKLRFRTSFGQNILDHSIEMSHLAGAMAAELGANVMVAKRAALLHDLGKAIDFEVEGPHVEIGVDLCRRYGEPPEVIHAVQAHHGDVEAQSVEAVLVQCADAISSARPGARREALENYVKRLQKLETIAKSIPGVENSYAVQAGREIRVMVKPEEVDDASAVLLAHKTAKRIEEELQYPGHIKVTVIRETRAVEYAK